MCLVRVEEGEGVGGEEGEEEGGEDQVEAAPGSVGEDLHHQGHPHHQGHIHHRGHLHLGQKVLAQEAITITTSPTIPYLTGEQEEEPLEEPLTMITGNYVTIFFGSDKSPRSDYQCNYETMTMFVCLFV